MGGPVINSIDLDTTSEGSVKRSSNQTDGEKFANALQEGAEAVAGIAGNLADVLPGGGAVLSAISSGLSGVASGMGGGGPLGAGSGSIASLLGGGPNYAGALGGGGGGGLGTNLGLAAAAGGGGGSAAGISKSQSSSYQQQLNMVQLQMQMQNQSQFIQLISAIVNIQHQTAIAIIQNIH